MRYQGRKPFQCRACGWICHRLARRAQDNALPVPGGDRALDSAANLLKTGGAPGRAPEHRDEMESVGAAQ
jgi:hypothetical protein